MTTLFFQTPRRSGFTLIELMVVIAVILILAGIAFTMIGPIQKAANRNKAETQMQLLMSGLEAYRAEAGAYPKNKTAATEGSKVVYQALSGNGNNLLGGNQSSVANPTSATLAGNTYVAELLPGSDGQHKFLSATKPFQIVDPWVQVWQYLAGDEDGPAPNQENPSFDLWSTAGGETDPVKWVSNFGS